MARTLPIRLAALSLVLAGATSVPAVEVRHGDAPARYVAELSRAFAPCTAPNTVAWNGMPACSPAVTSVCNLSSGTLEIEGTLGFLPRARLQLSRFYLGSQPEICRTGTHYVEIGVRWTGGQYLSDDDDGDCPSGSCTYPDAVVRVPVNGSGPFFLNLPGDAFVAASYEITSVLVIAPDGLPLASAAVGGASNTGITSNLSLSYERCDAPEPGWRACDAASTPAACDFNAGTLVWSFPNPYVAGEAAVTLEDVVGNSPLCTTGTYQVESTVRHTIVGCGDPFDPETCTLVDRQVLLPLTADGGSDVVASASFRLAAPVRTYVSTEIVATRLLDPTGAVLAVAAVDSVRALRSPTVTVRPDQIRVKTVIPIDRPFFTLDPTLEDGLTVTITDRYGPVYAVTIAAERWQLQPPIGARWDYKDKGGQLNGLRKARLKRVGKPGAVTGYSLDLQAKGIDLSGADFPSLHVAVKVASPDFLDDGYGAQRNRTCKVGGTKMACR